MGVVQAESPMLLSDKEVSFWARERLIRHQNTTADWRGQCRQGPSGLPCRWVPVSA